MDTTRITKIADNLFSFEFQDFIDAKNFQNLKEFEYEGSMYKILSKEDWSAKGALAPYLHAFRVHVERVV